MSNLLGIDFEADLSGAIADMPVTLTLADGSRVSAAETSLASADRPDWGGTDATYSRSFVCLADDVSTVRQGAIVTAASVEYRVLSITADPAGAGVRRDCAERYPRG